MIRNIRNIIKTILAVAIVTVGTYGVYMVLKPEFSVYSLESWFWYIIAYIVVLSPTIDYWRSKIE
jgi:hypothetical protein